MIICQQQGNYVRQVVLPLGIIVSNFGQLCKQGLYIKDINARSPAPGLRAIMKSPSEVLASGDRLMPCPYILTSG